MELAQLGWLIFFLPLLSFLVIVFLTRPYPKISGYVTIAAVGLAFLASIAVLALVIGGQSVESGATYNWITIPNIFSGSPKDFSLPLGVTIDPLAAIMLVVVTGVSLLVQIYSQGYMAGDPGYSRYYAFMSLFTASMLGLVIADSLVMVYFFWELVGLCSYLLIGFWFQRPSAASAAKKAFITTRLGDLGFLAAILYLFWSVPGHTLNIAQLNGMAEEGKLAFLGIGLTLGALGIFAGAVGKSAQFPLHVWLPDAMEGPTPVSALIHAATMVAAGVYLVGRMYPLFEATRDAMTVVAFVGGFTAIFAASMGLVMFDVKKVMAYSTISQLGYMMMALGVGGLAAGIFHLFNHAFFKALLFLGSGSMIHGTDTQDMREMGGLRKTMPVTFVTVLIASLSLAGIPPFSGFWSKDEILADTLGGHNAYPILFVVGLAAAFMTAFYMFRLMFVAFGGQNRGKKAENLANDGAAHAAHALNLSGGHTMGAAMHVSDAHAVGHHAGVHESPLVMTLPLMILAALAVVTGFLNFNGWFASFIEGRTIEVEYNFGVMGASVAVALFGIFCAWVVYGLKWISAESLGKAFGPAHRILTNKYYMDHLYEDIIVGQVTIGICAALSWIDKWVVDGIVNGIAYLAKATGEGVRRAETGMVQAYALVIFAGLLVLLALWMFGVPTTVAAWLKP